MAVIAVLIALAFPVWQAAKGRASRASMVSVMRSTGLAINLYASDHAGLYPGPLWPGQVAEYSAAETGRLVVVLASYLGLKEGEEPHIVGKFLPSDVASALPSVPRSEIRVFVMNTSVSAANGSVGSPWGSLTPSVLPPGRAAQYASSTNWAMSEAYQSHPAVMSRPWRMSTPPLPLSGRRPLGLFFDGRVAEFSP